MYTCGKIHDARIIPSFDLTQANLDVISVTLISADPVLYFRSAPEVKIGQISPKCHIFPEVLR